MAETVNRLDATVQNITFQEFGFLPVHDLACSGGSMQPEKIHSITRQVTTTRVVGPDRFTSTALRNESLPEKYLFVEARGVATGTTRMPEDDRQPFLDVVPAHILDAAKTCGATILANECPMYVVTNGAIRDRR